MRPPLLFHLYTMATMLLVPFVAWSEIRKLRRAGLPVLRAHERLGHASEPRVGSGPLIWFHAASVGESLSVLSLIGAMGRLLPRARFLITTGTASSAQLLAARLPERAQHQFAPLDAPGPVKRFLAHWRPAAAVFVESELWPQMLNATRDAGIAMALVNARMSARSRAAWQKTPQTAHFVLSRFDLILTQNDDMAQAMVDMHAPPDRVARGINLKSLSAPLPQDPAVLAQVRTAMKGRPVWVAASTHKGEEELVLEAHKALRRQHDDLLLILAPRHPARGSEIAWLCDRKGLGVAVRSHGELPTDQAVYLADTLGELGNWYALSKIVFLGGSLVPIGGHNPFEVSLAGGMVLSGPHVANFVETYQDMQAIGAAQTVHDAPAIASVVDLLLADRNALEEGCRAARDHVREKSSQVDTVAERLIRALKLPPQNR